MLSPSTPTSLLNYQLLKAKSGEQRPYLTLIHGLFGSLENLNMVAKVLSEHFNVVSVDVRNHGNSFHQEGMDYQTLAKDVVNLLDHLDIAETLLLGHSMGGKIAMTIALTQPERVTKLVVADIAPIAYPAHHQQIIEGLLAIDHSQVMKRSDADKQLSAFVEDAGVRQFLLRNLKITEQGSEFKCSVEKIAQGYSQIMAATESSTTYDQPTLFVKGGNSNYITAEHREAINALFSNSSAKIIQGAGHWLHAEKTVAFNKIVSDFLLS